MKYSIKLSVISLVVLGLLILSSYGQKSNKKTAEKIHFEPNWESLSQWTVPEWFDKAVLGIYCHWGVYSVPGFRFNDGSEQVDSGLWYGWFMYVTNDAEQDKHQQNYTFFKLPLFHLCLLQPVQNLGSLAESDRADG